MDLKLKSLILALTGLSIVSLTHAAGIDRSTQPSWAFTQDGTFAYVEGISINPKVSGKDISGNAVPNMTTSHQVLNYGAKADVNDRISLGVYYDQPWGADAKFEGNNNYTNPTATGGRDSTEATVKSHTYTGIVGVKLGEKKHFQVFAGPVLQEIDADVKVRGAGFGGLNGYDLKVNDDSQMGWLAGVAYTKPEIALKTSLTYRSEINHSVKAQETLPLAAKAGFATSQTAKMDLDTPKSVNLDFQTGLNHTTLLTAKLRWVPWSKFSITPPLLNTTVQRLLKEDLPLINYKDDAWSGEIGIAKKLNNRLAVSGTIGMDTGAGDPVNTLGPVKGNKNIGVGVKYNLTPEWAVSGVVKYLKFGDAIGNLPSGAVVGNFADNSGWVYGLRLSYQKK